MPNHLKDETSPYLLQHAQNPVDWYPWGEEALRKAREEDKPIFLSIGYSACHWCHVMAHESFEDAATADLLNEHFVSIKVDREERPEIDRIYMSAVVAMTGSGGWPLSAFLTPEGEPFYGGTYFPAKERYGIPAFTQILNAIDDAWQNRREELLAGSRRVIDAIRREADISAETEPGTCRAQTLQTAFSAMRRRFDPVHGGWGPAPKFPQPMPMQFLLAFYASSHHYEANGHTIRDGGKMALEMLTKTLDEMAHGGLYDQVGGGFHRYSVDAEWLTPHFEKMLYDNAQLARLYLHAWQAVGDPFYRTIAEETLDYVVREMMDDEGGFYSSQDADSEGREGAFYVWTPDEIREALDDEERAAEFIEVYGVTEGGNFEGANILELAGTLAERDKLADAREKLRQHREKRPHPGLDDKVQTSWNGLMMAAFAEAGCLLDRDDYADVAERNAEFLLSALRDGEGRLLHTWRQGEAKNRAYLEDYADLIFGLLALYETTFDPRWYAEAVRLADEMIALFQAPTGFYDTAEDHEDLIVRPRQLQDNATPSGNGMAAYVLLRLEGLSGNMAYGDIARHSLRQMQPMFAQYPLAFGKWLAAMAYEMAQPREIAIIGERGAEDTRALLQVARAGYRPHQVIALGAPGSDTVPLLRDRTMRDGQAAAYVCRKFTCQQPVTDPKDLRTQLT